MPDSYELLDGRLRMFVTQLPELPLTFNQYLLLSETPVLVHTGGFAGAAALTEGVLAVLGDRPLAYVFASHFESDECGGIVPLLEAFPTAVTVCSGVTARQLAGFGLTDRTLVKAPGETLELGDAELSFVGYPSEMHMWEGLLAFETSTGTLFSSDLIMRFGPIEQPVVASAWRDEVDGITPEKIPDPAALAAMRDILAPLPVRLIACGHGPALAVAG